MPEAFQSTVALAGYLAVEVVEPAVNILHGFSHRQCIECFKGSKLIDGEAVMQQLLELL